MIKAVAVIVGLFLYTAPSFAACTPGPGANEWTTADSSLSAALDCQTAATAGDLILVVAGTSAWNSSATFNKALTWRGAGVGVTNIAFTGAAEGIVITKQVGTIKFQDFSFSTNSGGAGNHPILINGSWTGTNPIIFEWNALSTETYTLITSTSPGGIIWAHNAITADYNSGPLTIKDPTNSNGSWTTDPTMGTDDTSGLLNAYFEQNTVYGSTNGVFDCDDGCRIVVRHNDFTYGMFNSHGYDSSPYGMRHFELYSNTYSRGDPDNLFSCNPPFNNLCIGNVNQAVWIRGGTGAIYNNQFEDTYSSTWGHKPIIRINARAYGQPTLPNIGLTCMSIVGAAPLPRQPGQSYVSGSQVTDPIYFWGNTNGSGGSTWDLAEVDDFGDGWNDCSNPWSDFFNWGTDAINQPISGGSAKPGYTAYTYPHPLVSVNDPGGSCTPDHLDWATQPSNAVIGASVPVGVQVLDAGGNLCITATNTITIANKGGTCTGMSIGGSTSGAASGGVFNSTITESAAGACTLSATASGLTGADSSAFTISAASGLGLNIRLRLKGFVN